MYGVQISEGHEVQLKWGCLQPVASSIPHFIPAWSCCFLVLLLCSDVHGWLGVHWGHSSAEKENLAEYLKLFLYLYAEWVQSGCMEGCAQVLETQLPSVILGLPFNCFCKTS